MYISKLYHLTIIIQRFPDLVLSSVLDIEIQTEGILRCTVVIDIKYFLMIFLYRWLGRDPNLFSLSVENNPSNIPSATNQMNQHTKDIDEALSCDHSNKSSNSSTYCDRNQSKIPLKSLSECNIDEVSKNLDTTNNSLPAEQNHEIQTKKPSKCNLSLDLANNKPTATKKQLFSRPEPLTCPSPVGSHNSRNNNHHPINK